MSDDSMKKYYEELKNETKQIGGGGGGIIGKVRVETGWKVIGSGVTQEQSWFPAEHSDKKAVAVARKAAQKLADEIGAKKPSFGIGIVLPRENCYSRGEKATWSVPVMVRFSANFWTDYDTVMLPSLAKNKIRLPWEGWARVGQCPDPSGYENSEGKVKDVYFIEEVFKNAIVAKKAIDQMPKGDGDNDDVPEMYRESPDVWEEVQAEIKVALENGDDPEEIAEDNGIDLRYVEAIQKTIIPM